jgi:succinate dehydrogenase/fumarate reductase-like Fe-S protein
MDDNHEHMIPIFLMGKQYLVPQGLTILKAIEFAGYRLIRGCGCRSGFCGACATVYRVTGNPRLGVALACQTLAEPNMYLAQLPSFPAPRATYRLEELRDPENAVLQAYPEILRCLGCGACSRYCPQELKVKDFVAAISDGQLQRAAELSFECLMCGLCALRCPASIVPYHAALLARRIHGRFTLPQDAQLNEVVQRIEAHEFEAAVDELARMDKGTLKRLYEDRDFESVQ